MKNRSLILLPLSLCVVFLLDCCKKDDDKNSNTVDDFDRQAMLENVTNNYIVPAYANYENKTGALHEKSKDFTSSPSVENLTSLREVWKEALLAWQDVAFLEFGPAQEILLRSQTNVFPIDTALVKANIEGTFDLASVSNYKAKGFQAIDYLLHLPGKTTQEIVAFFEDSNSKKYLKEVCEELHDNSEQVSSKWTAYKTQFIANNTSNGQGSAMGLMVNALSSHYETYVRKGKVGLPSGVFNGFSKQAMPGHVEALYYGKSLPFANRSIASIKKYFNGIHFSTGSNGQGLDDYLTHTATEKDGKLLATQIENQFAEILTALSKISDPFSDPSVLSSTSVSDTYQAMQKLVILIKIDLTAALGVLISYQDTDGD